MKNQMELSDFLTNLAQMVENMPDDQFNKLVKGRAISPPRSSKRAAKSKGAVAISSAPSEIPKSVVRPKLYSALERKSGVRTSLSDSHSVLSMKLHSAPTRDAGILLLENSFLSKEELLEFAKFLDIPVQSKDKSDRIRDKIIAFTVGRRLDSEAIRGGYTAK